MLYQLDAEGICASSGSACTSGSLEPSHVLIALGRAFHGRSRLDPLQFESHYNTDADVDHIVSRSFPRVVENLRKLSPYWDQAANAPRQNAEELIGKTH